MVYWDYYYLCLMEIEAARRTSSAASDRIPPKVVSSPARLPWPFGVALLVVALGTIAAALWHS